MQKLYCSLCRGDNTHIMEGKPLKGRIPAHWNIVNLPLNVVEQEQLPKGAEHPADAKCLSENPKYSGHLAQCTENTQLINLSQNLPIICATRGGDIRSEEAHECGKNFLLSELPAHYLLDHWQSFPPLSEQTLNTISEKARARGGIYLWDVGNFAQHLINAATGRVRKIFSPDFSTAEGYKLCMRLDPCGNGEARGKCVSLFFAVRKGDNDELLQWPLRKIIKYEILGEGGDVLYRDLFSTDVPIDSAPYPMFAESFRQPTEEMNKPIGDPRCLNLDSVPDMLVEGHLFINVIITDPPALRVRPWFELPGQLWHTVSEWSGMLNTVNDQMV